MPRNRINAFAPIVRGENSLSVRNASGDTPQIVLIGTVGKSWFSDEGITEKEVRDALKTIPRGTKFESLINSEGGSVKEGLGIYNAFRERGDDCTAIITGYALSIASIFPLGASKVVSKDASIWMMHQAWSWTEGNADDHESSVAMLREHDEALAKIYANKTGRPIQEMRDAMAEETWLRGAAAVDFGLADEGESDDAAASYRPLNAEFVNRCKNLSGVILNMVAPKTLSAGVLPVASPNNKPNSIMNRKQIEALLKKHRIEFPADATDEQLAALLEKIPSNVQPQPLAASPAVAPAAPQNQDAVTVAQLQAQLTSEKRTRITAEVKRRGENKIANDRIETWVGRAMADETVLAEIDAMPVAFEAGQPIASNRPLIAVGDDVFAKIKKMATHRERHAAALKDWDGIYNEAITRDARKGLQVMASNTIAAAITADFLIDGSVTDLQNVWAPLLAFSVDYTTDPYKPKAQGQLKHVASATATQTNATNFELGDTTVNAVAIAMNQYTQPFNISSSDMSAGLRLENIRYLNLATFANKVIEVATAPITVANFGAAAVVKAAANFGYNELSSLQALLKKSPVKNLILDGAYIARIANAPAFFQMAGVVGGDTKSWKAFGWDIIAPNSDWTGADPKVQGFACHPQAIAGITGLPLIPPNIPGGIFQSQTFAIPGIGATVLLSTWFNPSTRKLWTSFDIMAGFAAVDLTAGYIVATT